VDEIVDAGQGEGIDNNINDKFSEELKNCYKPLGILGDITLNEVAKKLKDLKWEKVIQNKEVVVFTYCL